MTRTENSTENPTETRTTCTPDAATDEADIRRLVADRVTAMQRGDASRLVADYAPDAVVFSMAPPLRQPTASVHDVEALTGWFAGHGGRVGYDVSDLQITVGGDVAFCHSLNRMGAPDDTPGHPFVLWFRSTLGLRRTDGGWLIGHEHTSTPFYMDGSSRAALDLTP